MMRNDTTKRLFTLFKEVAMKPILYVSKQNKSYARSLEGLLTIRIRGFFVGILMAFSVLLLSGGALASMCIIPHEEGNWENYDSQTRGITRLEFQMECWDASQTICEGHICTRTFAVKSHYFVHLFGSCYPTDCDWGEVEGERLTGNLEGWYRFYYNQGFATRYVYIQTYPQWPGWLRLWIYTDFADPGRADYVMDQWFLKQ